VGAVLKIDLFAFTFNDEKMLPFFIDYYKPIVDHMTFIDSGSTDKTLKLIKDYKVINTGLTTWDWDAGHVILQNVWKDSKADYIFFPNVDEIFYRQNLRAFLELNIGRIDIFQMVGFQMVADSFPKKGSDILDINIGIPDSLYDKYMIFSPKADITFLNAHNIKTNSKKVCSFAIKLLHYKFLGVEEQLRRAKLVKQRVPATSFCKGINGNILKVFPGFIQTKEKYQATIDQMLEDAKIVI
jgi:hypothetical protein